MCTYKFILAIFNVVCFKHFVNQGIQIVFEWLKIKKASVSFFFQAEDGIRDYKVTGVQTCGLPISITGSVSAYAWKPLSSPTTAREISPASKPVYARSPSASPKYATCWSAKSPRV